MTTEPRTSRGRGKTLLACLVIFLVALTAGLYYTAGPGAFRRLANALPEPIRPSWAHPLGLAPPPPDRRPVAPVTKVKKVTKTRRTGRETVREISPFGADNPRGMTRGARVREERRERLEQENERKSHRRPSRRDPEGTSASERDDAPETSFGEFGPTTLAYWNRLNEIIEREFAMRGTPSKDDLDEESAGGFLQRRKAAAEYANEAIDSISREDVDPEVLELADEIMAWYDDTIAACRSADRLMAEASDSERKGGPGKSWQREEQRLTREVERINASGARLRERLSREYNLPFPPLS